MERLAPLARAVELLRRWAGHLARRSASRFLSLARKVFWRILARSAGSRGGFRRDPDAMQQLLRKRGAQRVGAESDAVEHARGGRTDHER